MSVNHRRTIQLVGTVLALSLALAGCSSAPEHGGPSLPEGHAPIATDGSVAPAEPSDPEKDVVSASRLAVASGISMAYALGFDKAREITGADLESLRQPPADTLKGVTVDPGTCAEVIEGLNWSPVQQGGEGARSDFINEKISVTGSVEVARIQDRAQLDAHLATARRLLGECHRLTLDDGSGAIPFSTVAPVVKDGGADSAILWTRAGEGHPMRQQALVLIKERGDHVAMVSFIAASNLQKPEFAKIAGQVLEAALSQL
ncbi:hypothetical protein [Paeniglutamicibacter cryotolerans]|uniref:Sensor domain-containing protein n=1 Tax=Paeniglutamicibacter cryotolerans TaxID=670079 RepID=A0A839QFC7_9MICC|nr:hypothetical protein [Paeniglutamicibacter cryotolerans]MBB2994323.1 hypothetical protein [Paeniglutamicibacter cryotolerans]